MNRHGLVVLPKASVTHSVLSDFYQKVLFGNRGTPWFSSQSLAYFYWCYCFCSPWYCSLIPMPLSDLKCQHLAKLSRGVLKAICVNQTSEISLKASNLLLLQLSLVIYNLTNANIWISSSCSVFIKSPQDFLRIIRNSLTYLTRKKAPAVICCLHRVWWGFVCLNMNFISIPVKRAIVVHNVYPLRLNGSDHLKSNQNTPKLYHPFYGEFSQKDAH